MALQHHGRERCWYDDRDEVVTVVRRLLDTCQISTIDEVLYAFEKPWKLDQEREALIASERRAA